MNSGLSNIKIASQFGCGCTQVANILLNKTAILEAYTNGANAETKYLQPRNCMYPDIDTKVWEFYCEARSKNMPVNGGLWKAEALAITKDFNYKDFSASNGWLDSFSTRHQLRYGTLHGESTGVDSTVCNKWKEQLPRLCAGYKMEDIYNVDETGIFFGLFQTNHLQNMERYPMEQKNKHLKKKDSLYYCVAMPSVKRRNHGSYVDAKTCTKCIQLPHQPTCLDDY